MPYTPNCQGVAGFVIVEPDGDRPYFCHKLPLEYVRQASTRGGRVYAFEFELKEGASPPVVREIDVTRYAPRRAVTTLPWRGSVTDLATDIRGTLSESEVGELLDALRGPKRGERVL